MSHSSSSRNQHRRFIAVILSLSLAITGISAAPARADEDVAKFIAGMAFLGLLGAAINDSRHEEQRAPVAAPPPPPPHSYHRDPYHHDPYHRGPRPLPPRVAKYDLPAQCVRYFPRYSKSHTLLGQNCLQRNYVHEQSLPQSCRVTFWNGPRHRTGSKSECLQRNGYRIVRR